MRPKFLTAADLTLEHQVIFSHGDSRGQNVSCNCRLAPGEHENAGKLYASSMGLALGIEKSRELYNDPENHFAPFFKEDEAKW